MTASPRMDPHERIEMQAGLTKLLADFCAVVADHFRGQRLVRGYKSQWKVYTIDTPITAVVISARPDFLTEVTAYLCDSGYTLTEVDDSIVIDLRSLAC